MKNSTNKLFPFMIDRTDFLSYLSIKRGLSDRTVDQYSSLFSQVMTWLDESKLSLDAANLEKFLYAKYKKIRPSTLNGYIFFFQHLESYLADRGIKKDLASGFKIRKVESEPIIPLSVSEIKKLFSTNLTFSVKKPLLEKKERTNIILTKFLYFTCGRFDESVSLKWKYVDLTTGWVTFTDTKGKQSRDVPIEEPLISELAALREGRSSEDLVFINSRGKKILPSDFWEDLKKRCIKAGIPIIHAHVLRHTGATHMALNNVPLERISGILGHVNLDTTHKIYVHTQRSILREAIKRNPLIYEKRSEHDIIIELQAAVEQFNLHTDDRFKKLYADLMTLLAQYT